MKIGVLAGAFNPVTRAHVALADAARSVVDEIVCVVPQAYPHKDLHGASLDERIEMLRRERSFDRVEITRGGLFIEIARELRRSRPESELHFICGRDAAERVLGWNYGEPDAVERMLGEFRLLVAARQGSFDPPGHLREHVRVLEVPPGLDEISSTEVRRRIAGREPWEHLVPESAIELIRAIYSRK